MSETEGQEAVVRQVWRQTRRQGSAEEKNRTVLDGLRDEASISGLCRREGIPPNLFFSWSKAFLEAGQQRLAGDTRRYFRNHVDNLFGIYS